MYLIKNYFSWLQKQQLELEKELEVLHMITDGSTPRVQGNSVSPAQNDK